MKKYDKEVICPGCGSFMRLSSILRCYNHWDAHFYCPHCHWISPECRMETSEEAAIVGAIKLANKRALQKPMTFKEVKKLEDGQEVYIEYKVIHIDGYARIYQESNTMLSRHCGEDWNRLCTFKTYKKEWICWDHKPTDEERQAVVWNK